VKILLTGKDGQVGWELQRTLVPLGEVTATGRAELDLGDADAIRRCVRAAAPDVIVNAAAYTAVDRAETERELATTVNSVAPGIIAEEAKRSGALLVHYSTDYVFDGRKHDPYTEDDAPAPPNAYGATKLAGERAIIASGVRHLILRTSWVYAARGRNFLLTMLRLASERDELKVVDDQTGAPTSARAIATATAKILALQTRPPLPNPLPQGGRGDLSSVSLAPAGGEGKGEGVFHMSAGGSTTWFGFARAILAATEAQRGRSPKLIPITTEAYNAPAKRPKNSILCNDKLERVFGFRLPPWEEGLRQTLREFSEAPVRGS
jgi:dTDP-4-dehydrorhamnose reductase